MYIYSTGDINLTLFHVLICGLQYEYYLTVSYLWIKSTAHQVTPHYIDGSNLQQVHICCIPNFPHRLKLLLWAIWLLNLCLGPAHVTCCTSTIYKVTAKGGFIQQQQSPITVSRKHALHTGNKNHFPGGVSWMSVRYEAFQNNIPDKRSVVHSRSERKVRLSATYTGESMKNKQRCRCESSGFCPHCVGSWSPKLSSQAG